MSKITYEDLFALVDEMIIGSKDKNRTINRISNSKVKEFIFKESNVAISKGVTAAILASTNSIFTFSMLGSMGGIGTGILSAGLPTLGFAPLMAAGGAAAGGAIKGGAAGSALPVVGTVIGAAAGLGIGLLVVRRKNKKQMEIKVRLHQEVIEKQNTIIRDFEREIVELKEKYGDALNQNERYKYIIGILKANEELKVALEISEA